MAFDGITTAAMAAELRKELLHGKIDKIYQPGRFDIYCLVRTASGNRKVLLSCDSFSVMADIFHAWKNMVDTMEMRFGIRFATQ